MPDKWYDIGPKMEDLLESDSPTAIRTIFWALMDIMDPLSTYSDEASIEEARRKHGERRDYLIKEAVSAKIDRKLDCISEGNYVLVRPADYIIWAGENSKYLQDIPDELIVLACRIRDSQIRSSSSSLDNEESNDSAISSTPSSSTPNRVDVGATGARTLQPPTGPTGVSLLDASLAVNEDDAEKADRTKRWWQHQTPGRRSVSKADGPVNLRSCNLR